MKNVLLSTLILFLVSCTKETLEYTIISGKATETTDNKFGIRGNSFYKEIEVNPDGSFLDTLYIKYDGMYEIGREIYIEKGKHVCFEVDYSDIDNAIFTGDLAQENNYLCQKSRLHKEILGTLVGELYMLEETEFLDKITQVTKKKNELLENSTFSSENFKENEKKHLKYNVEYMYRNYEKYHSYLTKKEDFEVSDNFPKPDQTIDLDNVADFDFSSSYRMLVSDDFGNKIRDEYEKQLESGKEYSGEMIGDIAVKIFESKKSQNIKNVLARQIERYISPSNSKSEKLYNKLITKITDEKLKSDLTEKFNKVKKLTKGNPSPKFNYENHKGGTTSLDDLKGKYVYIDVWATWCGPCVGEIPFLKEVEEKYHGKNIEFVSISIDSEEDYQKWKAFVTEKQMGGIQLYARDAWEADFAQDYAINSIPRFILIDPQGNIISADAPRPSSEKLIELFTELNL